MVALRSITARAQDAVAGSEADGREIRVSPPSDAAVRPVEGCSVRDSTNDLKRSATSSTLSRDGVNSDKLALDSGTLAAAGEMGASMAATRNAHTAEKALLHMLSPALMMLDRAICTLGTQERIERPRLPAGPAPAAFQRAPPSWDLGPPRVGSLLLRVTRQVKAEGSPIIG
jgi:hypothetical protein